MPLAEVANYIAHEELTMPTYQFEAMDPQGQEIRDVIETLSTSLNELIRDENLIGEC